MKIIITLLIYMISVSCFSQQELSVCPDYGVSYTYVTSSGIPGIYTWEVDGVTMGNSDSSIFINWAPYSIGTHSIQVFFTSIDGCESSSIYYNITITECDLTTMYVPNCFTPNGDVNNNMWYPVGYNYKSLHFIIFNRWGDLLYESNDVAYGWDGTYKGNMCKNDVYTYVLEWIDNKNIQNRIYGHVTLLK
jgi:gliding motility-associated-like protein